MSAFELGGFAEWPEDIDGTLEEFNAFNYCLAEEYYSAVLGENFEALGEELNDMWVWHDLMGTVCEWLNYDGEIGQDKKDDFEKLYDGTIITCSNRTFIEAALEHGWLTLADDLTKELEEKGIQLKIKK